MKQVRFFCSSRRRHTRWPRDWSSDVCSSDLLEAALTAARDALGPPLVARLYELPERAELDDMLVCHGSPFSDIESFAPEAEAGEERLLVREANRTILFGHSHRQFRRPGPNDTLLVNPGSVGM